MRKIVIVFLFFCLCFIYFFNERGVTQSSLGNSSKNISIKNELDNGVYFLYKKCNLNYNKCHELQAEKYNESYFLDGNQEPNEERMYIYVRNNSVLMYSLIYYGEEMIPTIIWSELKKDKDEPFTYIIRKNTTALGLNYDEDINDFDFSNPKNSDNLKVKIGETPKGNEYKLNQKISFNIEKNGDFSIDCIKYLNNLRKLNRNDDSLFGGIFEMACDTDSFFRNTANYGEKRIIYFKKLK